MPLIVITLLWLKARSCSPSTWRIQSKFLIVVYEDSEDLALVYFLPHQPHTSHLLLPAHIHNDPGLPKTCSLKASHSHFSVLFPWKALPWKAFLTAEFLLILKIHFKYDLKENQMDTFMMKLIVLYFSCLFIVFSHNKLWAPWGMSCVLLNSESPESRTNSV